MMNLDRQNKFNLDTTFQIKRRNFQIILNKFPSNKLQKGSKYDAQINESMKIMNIY
jgi:hypothetical protein